MQLIKALALPVLFFRPVALARPLTGGHEMTHSNMSNISTTTLSG
jgi:hypothetical protein